MENIQSKVDYFFLVKPKKVLERVLSFTRSINIWAALYLFGLEKKFGHAKTYSGNWNTTVKNFILGSKYIVKYKEVIPLNWGRKWQKYIESPREFGFSKKLYSGRWIFLQCIKSWEAKITYIYFIVSYIEIF